MNVDLLYGIMVAVALSMILMFFQNFKRGKSWKATVTNIKKIEDEDNDGIPYVHYKVYYTTDSGKKGKLDLPEYYYKSKFASLLPGSRLIKVAGKDYPEIAI